MKWSKPVIKREMLKIEERIYMMYKV